jgi:hypothetical protein
MLFGCPIFPHMAKLPERLKVLLMSEIEGRKGLVLHLGIRSQMILKA